MPSSFGGGAVLQGTEPLTVLQLVDELRYGGTEKVALSYATHLNRKRFRSILGAFNNGGPLETEAKLRALQSVAFNHNPSELRHFVRDEGVNIVHIHSGFPGDFEAIRAVKDAGVRCVIRTSAFGWLDRLDASGLIDFNLFVSRFALRRYVRHSGRRLESVLSKSWVSYVPIDATMFRPDQDRAKELREQLGVSEDTLLIGRLGKADGRKLDPFLLRAISQIKRLSSKFCIVLLGGATDEVRRYVARSGMQGCVIEQNGPFTESEVANHLAGLDIYAHSSRVGESFSQAMAEAMATALPIVSQWSPYADDGTPEMVENGNNGALCLSPRECARALEWLLNDSELRKRWGQRSRAIVAERFLVGDLVSSYESTLLAGASLVATDKPWVPPVSSGRVMAEAEALRSYWANYDQSVRLAWKKLGATEHFRTLASRGYAYSRARSAYFLARSSLERLRRQFGNLHGDPQAGKK